MKGISDKILLLIVAILCITGLEAIALLKGIDGAVLSSVFSVIGGIVGYAFGKTPQFQPPAKKSKKKK